MPATPILFCSHVVELGGAENVLLDLLEALDRTRFSPHLAVPSDGPLPRRAAATRVPVHLIPIAGRTRLQKALAAMRASAALRRLAAELGCRVLVANSMIAGYAAVRAQHRQLACIWHLHIVTRSRIARLALSRATAVIAPSRAALDAGGLHRTGEVVANGVPDRYFAAAGDGLRDRLGIAHDTPLVGIVGRLDPDKGHDWLLRALARLPDRCAPHLIVAGGELFAGAQARIAGYADRLRQACADRALDDRVHWLGEVTDTAPLLAELDVLVVPSVAPEGAPRSIAEAQAAGCPVIASAVGGVPEMVVDGETGVLVHPDEPASLERALARLLGAGSERTRIAERARGHATSNYRMATFASRCEAVFRRVLAGIPSGPGGPGRA